MEYSIKANIAPKPIHQSSLRLGGQLTELIGTLVPAKTAILFDWDNRWAINDAQGPRNSGLHYEQTVMQHYRAFWEMGVPADIVGSEDDFSRYKLLVLPMAYLLREETGEKIERFVRAGGTVAVTYWSGIVGENDLCHLGGFPGPLRTTVGIWAEEIEGLYDHDRNALVPIDGNALGLTGKFEIRELCERIHAEGAEVLAVYEDDFYAGSPVLTVNRLGEGKAYYLAARVSDSSFYEAFYGKLAEEAGVRKALKAELPAGVTAQLRSDGERDYVFLLNFSGKEAEVQLDGRSYEDAESGQKVGSQIVLPVNGVRILRREAV